MNAGRTEVAIIDATPFTLRAAIVVGGESAEVWFRASRPLFVERMDALVPVGLFAAMRTRTTLVVPELVSSRLLQNLTPIQQILASFTRGELAPVSVVANGSSASSATGSGLGSFFGCGVDSFHSALKHEEEISDLVVVSGLDAFDTASPRAAAGVIAARAAARDLGKELIEVETNVQRLTERFSSPLFARGPALATVSLLLQSQLARAIVASVYPYQDLFPTGLHPLLDPLWRTESLEIIFDGCEATRTEKVSRIARSDTALRHLRVCNKQYTDYNCGHCEKCIRTMVNLRLAGALERCPTLPNSIDFRAITRIRIASNQARSFWGDNLRAARAARDWPVVLAVGAAHRPRPLVAVRHRLGRIRRALTVRRRQNPR